MININNKGIHVDGEIGEVMADTIMIVRTIAAVIWKQADDSSRDSIVHDMGVWVEEIIDATWQPSLKE